MFDAIVVSDIHLGSRVCQAARFSSFLDTLATPALSTARLIINGDLLEGDYKWLAPAHRTILWQLMNLRQSTELIWVRGNHDWHAQRVAWALGSPVPQYILDDILIVHGDRWDPTLNRYPLLVRTADCVYYALQRLNLRLARWIKRRSKFMTRCYESVQEGAMAHAAANAHRLVICGHTHGPLSTPRYVNSGCWTEDECSYVTIKDGEVELRQWSE